MSDSNKRLREARIGAGFKSARAAAIKHRWVPSTYSSHENGQTPVPTDNAKTYAKAFKVSFAWLLGDEDVNQPSKNGSESYDGGMSTQPAFESDGLASVPEMDALLAGQANAIEEKSNRRGAAVRSSAVLVNWGIPAPFLKSELHINPGRANIVPVRGDSMKDALFDGDRAIINLDDVDISQGGIFALLDESSSLIIKQVEVVRGSGHKKIRCTSRNPLYAPFDLELTDPVKIVGRVAGKITRL
jgi:phage repressor protein C with HTH and peptisase S24 domain